MFVQDRYRKLWVALGAIGLFLFGASVGVNLFWMVWR